MTKEKRYDEIGIRKDDFTWKQDFGRQGLGLLRRKTDAERQKGWYMTSVRAGDDGCMQAVLHHQVWQRDK